MLENFMEASFQQLRDWLAQFCEHCTCLRKKSQQTISNYWACRFISVDGLSNLNVACSYEAGPK